MALTASRAPSPGLDSSPRLSCTATSAALAAAATQMRPSAQVARRPLRRLEMYIHNIGNSLETGEMIDLRIRNMSEYRGYNVNLNGIKRVTSDLVSGYFVWSICWRREPSGRAGIGMIS